MLYTQPNTLQLSRVLRTKVMVGAVAGSVCCVAWNDDQQFATASADHVIHIHSGGQACTASLRGGMRDLTHLTWSPCGKSHTRLCLSCTLWRTSAASEYVWLLLYHIELRCTVMKSLAFGDTIRSQDSSSMRCPMANPACCLCAPTNWCQLSPGLLQFQSSLLHSLQVTPQWSRIAQFLHPHSLFVFFSSDQQVWYSAAVCAPKMGSTFGSKSHSP